jgi:hypothetical protein
MLARTHTPLTLTLALLLAGCGGSSPSETSSTSPGSTTAPTTSGTTTTPSTPVSDQHGTLTVEAAVAGGTAWAFLPDGATAAWEIVDPSGILAAGARANSTLTMSGDVEGNVGGATALGEAVRVSAFRLDDLTATGRVASGALEVNGYARTPTTWTPTGPLAAAVLAHPAGAPLRFTGVRDAATSSVEITSWRPTAEVELRVAGGLTGMDETFTVEDLPGTGASRHDYRIAIFPQNDFFGRGEIPAADRTAIEQAVAAADLFNQPTSFRPVGFIIFDAPTTYIRYADASGSTTISIAAGSTVPVELTALMNAIRQAKPSIATTRSLEQGARSGVTQAEVAVARTQAELQAIYARHAGAGATVPTVDFTQHVVVALFQGQQSSGGYAIRVSDVETVGDDVHVTVERTSPAPGSLVTLALTSPFQLATVERRSGQLFVDGVAR